MRIIVCGSRDFDDAHVLGTKLEDAFADSGYPRTVVHGAARGADELAYSWAILMNETGGDEITVEAHPADWTKYNNAAGPIRNVEMAKLGADLCLAFWDGKSRGTKHMIETAVQHGIPVRIVPWRKP